MGDKLKSVAVRMPDIAQPPATIADRRRSARSATVFTIGKISFGGRSLPCMVRNISEGGMRIQLPTPPRQGERVIVEMRGLDPLPAQVCWATEQEAGLMFHTPCDPTEIFLARSSRTGRVARQPRFPMQRHLSLLVDDMPISVTVENISVGGTLLSPGQAVEQGMKGVLGLTLGDRQGIAGEICWVRESGCGFRFVRPISSIALASMLDAPEML